MIECSNCDGKGGWVICDSASPGCDETDETEKCDKCGGAGVAKCEHCDKDAARVLIETIGGKIYMTLLCDSCFQNVQNEQSA